MTGEGYEFGNLFGRGFSAAYGKGKGCHLGRGGLVEGMNDGQRQLTFLHVVSCGLSGIGLFIEVEDVVAKLETRSRELSEPAHTLHLVLVSTGQNGTHLGAGGKERGRLLADDLVIGLFVEILRLCVGQLQQLTVGKRLSKLCHHTHHRGVAGLCGMHQRHAEQIVAHQHGHLVVCERIDRKLSAAAVALVHHIVMHKAGRVQQFQRHSGMQDSLVHLACQTGAEQHHERPHLLTGAVLQMLQGQVQQRILVAERCREHFGKLFQFPFDGSLYTFQMVHNIQCLRCKFTQKRQPIHIF